LISITASSATTQFLYDGDGNLVKKIKPDGSKTLYVGGIYEVDKNSGGTVVNTKTYYPAAGAMRVGSTLYYMLGDHLGSASVVTNTSGTIVGEDRFYPFGETRFTTGTMFTDKLYTGQREITGLGIYHYGARFYSPKLGRFLSADTVVPDPYNPQYLNRFSYVLNNPLRYTDPTGHRVCEDYQGSCLSENQVTRRYTSDLQARRRRARNRLVPITPTQSNTGSYINVPVSGGSTSNIYVPAPGGSIVNIYVPGAGGMFIDINVPVSIDTGFETFDPAPQQDNILFSKKNKDKNKDKKPLTGDDIKILEGSKGGEDVHILKGKHGSRRNLFKDRDGNIYEGNYDGSGEFEPLNINLNDLLGET
jgi:RHS repeat-associated protein